MSADVNCAPDDLGSGVRLVAEVPLVEPFFVVLFDCGGHISFQSVLDALDCMKDFEGATETIKIPGKVSIAKPRPFAYEKLWRLRADPEWVSQ